MPIKHFQNHPKIKIGPSSVEVNGNIWNAIASTRPLPVLNHMPQLTISSPPVIRDYPPTPSMFSLYRANPCEFNGFVSNEESLFKSYQIIMFNFRTIHHCSRMIIREICCSLAIMVLLRTWMVSLSSACMKTLRKYRYSSYNVIHRC